MSSGVYLLLGRIPFGMDLLFQSDGCIFHVTTPGHLCLFWITMLFVNNTRVWWCHGSIASECPQGDYNCVIVCTILQTIQ